MPLVSMVSNLSIKKLTMIYNIEENASSYGCYIILQNPLPIQLNGGIQKE